MFHRQGALASMVLEWFRSLEARAVVEGKSNILLMGTKNSPDWFGRNFRRDGEPGRCGLLRAGFA